MVQTNTEGGFPFEDNGEERETRRRGRNEVEGRQENKDDGARVDVNFLH